MESESGKEVAIVVRGNLRVSSKGVGEKINTFPKQMIGQDKMSEISRHAFKNDIIKRSVYVFLQYDCRVSVGEALNLENFSFVRSV